MYLLLVFLPLISFLCLFFFGRFLGKNGSAFLSLFNIFFSFLLSCIAFFEVVISSYPCFINLPLTWITVEILNIEWFFLFDSVSTSMLIVVFFVSSLVHLYSFEYMSDDPHLIRFISYLSFFTFFMLILLTSGNFIQMFLGWEGVGLSSYLLINFWFTRLQANKSAFKAMVVNRVGDLGLSFGIFLIFFFFGTLDFLTLMSITNFFSCDSINFIGFDLKFFDIVAFFLFLGVVGKSAQFGLHTWLPDALEGPTPVSALIHAATMVTAGVFLIIRCSFFFESSTNAMFLVSFIGALTAFFGSTVACFQTDLKKIIAYSTCSQLGYMIFACSFSLYSSGLFHFFNHAFFKALLFLSAGAIIHAVLGEQDIYYMGGMDIYLPFTAQMFTIGSVALVSLPFLSGFYSKDWILELAGSLFFFDGFLMVFLVNQAAVFTMLYSESLSRFVFDGDENFPSAFLKNVGESGFNISFSLAILALPSIFSGYLFKELFLGFGSFTFSDAVNLNPINSHFFESDYLPIEWKILPIVFSFFLLFLSIFGFDFLYNYLNNGVFFFFLSKFKYLFYYIFDFFSHSWYYDSLINFLVMKKIVPFSREITFKLIDKGVLEYLGPYMLVDFFNFFSLKVTNLITGYLFHYAFLMIFGLSLLVLTLFFFLTTLPFELIFSSFLFFFIFLAFDF